MAAVNGTAGSVSFSTGVSSSMVNLEALANRWSADLVRESNDITPYSPASNARKNLGSLQSMSGTAEGFLDGTNPFLTADFDNDLTVSSFVLKANAGVGAGMLYTFTGILTGFSVSAETGVPNTWTCSFVSSGAITVTYDGA